MVITKWKKLEYKKIHLYDEDYDSDFERNGGYHYDHEWEDGWYCNEDRHDYNEQKQDHGKRDHYEKEYHHRDRKGRGDDEDHEDYYYKDYRHGEKDFRDYENKWEYNGTLDFFLSLLLFLIKINVSFVYYKSYCKLKLFINKYFLYLFL